MFTGIIEELGIVRKIQRVSRNTLLEIEALEVSQDTSIGDSIAVNGVCLTVVKKAKQFLSFEVMPQTFKATNLNSLKLADKVNLERSLKMGARISGHFVYGHVDCLGIIRRKRFIQNNLCFEIAVGPEFISGIVLRGSVAVDGISLTVQQKKSNLFSVYIIGHTLGNTTLNFKSSSDKVNIEIDKLTTFSSIKS